jgi:hypothetical protein
MTLSQVTGCGGAREEERATAFLEEFNTKCQTMRKHLHVLDVPMSTSGVTVAKDEFWDAAGELDAIWMARHSFTNSARLRGDIAAALAICDELYEDIQRVGSGENTPGGFEISSGAITVTDSRGNRSNARAVNTTKDWCDLMDKLNHTVRKLKAKNK